MIHFQIPPEVIALVCQVRRERGYGAPRLSLFLQRYHHVYISPTTLLKIFRQHGLRERTWKGARRPPKRQPLPRHVGERLQVDVKFVPRRITGARQFYQFTAIDEATRFRVLRVYDQNSTKSARAFLDEVRRVLPVAIKSIQTDHGSEFGWDFTWHLRDVGITHARIPRGYPQSNGKVERSHRTDEEKFCRHLDGANLTELAQRMAAWEAEYNFGRPHLSLKGQTPAEALIKAAEENAKSVQEVSGLFHWATS